MILDENKKGDFTEPELREIRKLIEENKELIYSSWNYSIRENRLNQSKNEHCTNIPGHQIS